MLLSSHFFPHNFTVSFAISHLFATKREFYLPYDSKRILIMLDELEVVPETVKNGVQAPPPPPLKKQQQPKDQQQRYRGVYKCGKRFKAQLQSGG